MSRGKKGFVEKLEHSVVIDLLGIGLYAYFAFVMYTNLGFDKSVIYGLSFEPNVLGFQLAAVMIMINALQLVHDKVIKGKDDGYLH